MGEKDTFYFLKVELGIDTCEEVAAIERLKHGPEYLWLWIRLALYMYITVGGCFSKKGKTLILASMKIFPRTIHAYQCIPLQTVISI